LATATPSTTVPLSGEIVLTVGARGTTESVVMLKETSDETPVDESSLSGNT
jgi:hypothetical protein